MTHPLILLIVAMFTGATAFSYAKAKGGDRIAHFLGTLAFLLPVSLPLITLYLIGRPLPPGTHLKPFLIVMLTLANLVAAIGIVLLVASLTEA